MLMASAGLTACSSNSRADLLASCAGTYACTSSSSKPFHTSLYSVGSDCRIDDSSTLNYTLRADGSTSRGTTWSIAGSALTLCDLSTCLTCTRIATERCTGDVGISCASCQLGCVYSGTAPDGGLLCEGTPASCATFTTDGECSLQPPCKWQ